MVATLLGAEEFGLRIASVPDPVHEDVGGEEEEHGHTAVGIFRGVVVGQEDGAVAVRKRHAGHVPENEHEAPLLVKHVPKSVESASLILDQRGESLEHQVLPAHRNQFLALGARVGIQKVGHEQEAHLGSDIAVRLPLSRSTTKSDEKQNVPGQANLEEHLHVDPAEHSRVELGAHEKVVDGVACHPVLRASCNGADVGDERNDETGKYGDAHDGTKLVNQSVELEEPRDVKSNGGGDCNVETPHARAVVGKLLVLEVRQRLALDVDSREKVIEDALRDAKDPVDGPRPAMRKGASVGELNEVLCKVEIRLVRRRARGEFAVVIVCANPHVPHEGREANHHHNHTGRTAKVKVRVCVNLGVAALEPAVDDARLGCLGFGCRTIGLSICIPIDVAVGVAIALASHVSCHGCASRRG